MAKDKSHLNYVLVVLFCNAIIHYILFPLNHQPDRFEKELGVALVRNPEVSMRLDFYPQMLSGDANVYFFYAKLLGLFESLQIPLTLIQFCVSSLILLSILQISTRLFASKFPAITYTVAMLGFSGLLVYPDFLYTDPGFAPRQVALLSTIFAIRLYINSERPAKIGIILGFGALVQPSVGAVSFVLLSISTVIKTLVLQVKLLQAVKDQLILLMSFLISGGWFASVIALEQISDQNNLSPDAIQLSTWTFSVLRHPYTLFDWRQLLLLFATSSLVVYYTKKSIHRFTKEKKLLASLMVSSLILYFSFIVGIHFQIPILISLYGIRVYNVWFFGTLLLAGDILYNLIRNQALYRIKNYVSWNMSQLISSMRPTSTLFKFSLFAALMLLLAQVASTQQAIKNDKDKYDMISSLETHFGDKFLADEILAPTSMQIVGSIHHWKTIPRSSSDVLMWIQRLDDITANLATEKYSEFDTPIITWDHNKFEYLQEFDRKTLQLNRMEIQEICRKYPIKVFITPQIYKNKMKLEKIYESTEYKAYRVSCADFESPK